MMAEEKFKNNDSIEHSTISISIKTEIQVYTRLLSLR
jgi:hypothetical protein